VVEPLVIKPYDIDGARIVLVGGEIDAATAPQLAEVLDNCDGPTVCVDLTDVTFVDSTGLAVFATAYKRAAERGAAFMVQNVTPHVRRVFEITTLDHLLAIEPL